MCIVNSIGSILGMIATEASEETLAYNAEKRRLGYIMDYLPADLEPYKATDNEKRIAAEFTRIAACGELPEHAAWLKVGDQYFKVNEAENASHASWHCWMLAKALATVRRAVVVSLNGREVFAHPIFPGLIGYDELVKLAGTEGQPSITYQSTGIQGMLSPSSTVGLVEGMVINVAHTNKA